MHIINFKQEGQYSVNGSTSCSDCGQGKYGTIPPSDECVVCSIGTFNDNSRATYCTASMYCLTYIL